MPAFFVCLIGGGKWKVQGGKCVGENVNVRRIEQGRDRTGKSKTGVSAWGGKGVGNRLGVV